MNNLDRISINSKKLLKNDELLKLKGGSDPDPCGEGFDLYCCSFRRCGYDYYESGHICAPENSDPLGWLGDQICLDVLAWNHCGVIDCDQ